MQLIRFGKKGSEKPGVLLNGKRKDCSGRFKDWDHAFFQSDGLRELASYLKSDARKLPDVPETERHGACIARPGMILCIGLNYSDHAKESKMELPKEPIIFGKASNTLGGPYDEVAIPKNGLKTDYEIELGVVLNKNVSYLASEQEAEKAIAGYCLVNDLSERSFQLERGGQWIKGKSCPGFSPVGPHLCTADAIKDATNLNMKLTVNGEIRQESNTRFMIFKPAFLIYYLSQFMMLEAGDLISTGTPSGVALGMHPPVYLKKDDEVALSMDGLGMQKQRFI